MTVKGTGLGGYALQWQKVGVALPFTTFQTAGLTINVNLFLLVPAGTIHAIKIKHSTNFTGGAIATCLLSVGIAGSVAKYASAFDVFQAASATAFQVSSTVGSESHTAAVQITCTMTSTVANLSALTQGTVDIWALLGVPQ